MFIDTVPEQHSLGGGGCRGSSVEVAAVAKAMSAAPVAATDIDEWLQKQPMLLCQGSLQYCNPQPCCFSARSADHSGAAAMPHAAAIMRVRHMRLQPMCRQSNPPLLASILYGPRSCHEFTPQIQISYDFHLDVILLFDLDPHLDGQFWLAVGIYCATRTQPHAACIACGMHC